MAHRKKLIIERKGDYITVKDKDNKTLRRFRHNPKIKKIDNFKTQKEANEKVLLEYYRNRDKGHIYKPTTKEEFNKRFYVFMDSNKAKKYFSDMKIFKKGTSLTFSNQRRLKEYDFMYVQVKLKIHFDGYYTVSTGRGKYYYYPNEVPDSKLTIEIHQATLNCLAPFGSNLDFRFLSWQFVYHKTEEQTQKVLP